MVSPHSLTSWLPTERVSPNDRLDTLPSADLRPDGSLNFGWWREPGWVTLGWHAMFWLEGTYGGMVGDGSRHDEFEGLRQPNGPRAGRPVRLTTRQRRFLMWWYSMDENGRWRFYHAVRRLSKGSGKSPFAAMLCLLELCGPVRGFVVDPYHPDPVQRVRAYAVDMPWVQIAATAESQTHNTMRMVRAMAARGTPLNRHYQLDPGKTQIFVPPEGKLEVITSSFTAAEGAEPSFLMQDETEHSTPSNGGPELAATLADNASKSGARTLETSNAWVPGRQSVAEDTWAAWVAQEEGTRHGESLVLYDAVLSVPTFEADLADRDKTRAELQRIYADCDWKRPHRVADGDLEPDLSQPPDVESIMTRIYDSRSSVDDTLRKYGNRPTAMEDAWTTSDAWSALSEWREVDPDEPIALFFDGSKSQDATVLTGCAIEDGYTFVIAAWERPPGLPTEAEWNVPVGEVDYRVQLAHQEHRVLGFFGDVREWESFVHVAWPEKLAEYVADYAVLAKPLGNNPGPIAWDMRGHVAEFTRACEVVYDLILNVGFKHDGHPVMHRHVVNARRHPNNYGVSIAKESPRSPRKIDGAVTMIGAQMVRQLVLASEAWKTRAEPERKSGKRAGRVVGWS